MTTRQILDDVARCLRAAVPPLVTLGVLTLARTAHANAPSSAETDKLFLAAWWAAIIATQLWLLIAVIWAATRPLRDRQAFDRLQHLREIGTPPDRALVHVQTSVWSSPAGQLVVVVNVATGATSRVWLCETTVRIGSFVVLERAGSGVSVVGAMSANHVESAHRHERCHSVHRPNGVELRGHVADSDDRDDARHLIEETEQFLKEQEPHW